MKKITTLLMVALPGVCMLAATGCSTLKTSPERQAQMDRNPWVNNAQSRDWSGADADDKGAGFIAGLLQMFVH